MRPTASGWPGLLGLVVAGVLALGCGPRGAAPSPRTAAGLYESPPLKAERTAAVDVLWVRRSPNPDPEADEDLEVAGITRVRLRVAPNPHGAVAIGVAEQFPGGAGDTWKAAVWLAARAASRALGRELTEHRFLAESQGFIDGPSAGALFTAGFLAAALGVPIRPEVTMTGTVTPDGTVGRVGGVALKLRAALKAGKRIIGYPAGNALVKGPRGSFLNLETMAAEHGAKAVPVRDIYEAFALLTGRTLPPLPAATAAELALPRGLADGLRRRAQAWQVALRKQWARAETRAGDPGARARLKGRLATAFSYARLSREAEQRGAAGLAWYAAVRSASWTDTAVRLVGVAPLWQGWLGARQRAIAAVAAGKAKRSLAARTKEDAALRARLCPPPRRRGPARRLRPRPRPRPRRRAQRLAPSRRGRSRRQGAAPGPGVLAPRAAPRPRAAAPPTTSDLGAALLARARAAAAETQALHKQWAALEKRRPQTVGEALAVVAAYAELFEGAAYASIGEQRLGRLGRALGEAATDASKALPTLGEVEDAVRFAALARSRARIAAELATLVEPGGRALRWTAARRRVLADQLFAAAKANLDYLHSLLPSGEAGANAQKLLASHSADYVIAELGVTRGGRLVILPGLVGAQAPAAAAVEDGRLVVLGAAVASYLASSKLLAKMFTIGIGLGTGKAITAVGSGEQLTIGLHRARRFSLEAAHRAAVRAGRVPAYARVLFQTADTLRKENLAGQVKALELYWRAGLFCRLAEQLAR